MGPYSVTAQAARAERLRELHRRPELLHLLNVWDVASARAVAARPETSAIATASAAIAESHGYEDGEHIPLELHLAAIRRICSGVELPVTADLERGYGDVCGTTREAIDAGAVGINLEDDMAPAEEFADAVRAAVAAGAGTGVPLVVNARTDVYLRWDEREGDRCGEAIRRGRLYLDAGADCVFLIGMTDRDEIATAVEALGRSRVSLLALPGLPDPGTLERLGVARLSHGPGLMKAAMSSVSDYEADVYAGTVAKA